MPLLGPGDPLPARPHRIVVAGPSGSGKTTLARHLAELLDLRHVEIDSLFHGPGWTKRPTFVADVEGFVAGDRWVTEWQYDAVRSLVAYRADLFVWLDLRRSVVMGQVVRRTVRRRLHREALWGVNVEPPLWTVFTDREHIVRWAWRTYPLYDGRVTAVRSQRPDLPVVQLTSRAEVERWLDGPVSQVS